MAYEYLQGKDWTLFKKLHPSAASWLLRRELSREREALERDQGRYRLNPWQEARLIELDALLEQGAIDDMKEASND